MSISKGYDVEYNPSLAPIAGAKQSAKLAVATGVPDYTVGTWYGGVNNDYRYIIVSDTTSDNLVGAGTGGGTGAPAAADSPLFWSSDDLSDASLISTINRLPGSPGNFTDVATAKNWISTSGIYGILNDIFNATLVLSLDAGNMSSYPGSGTVWTDTVGGKQFNLNNGVGYDSANGGKFHFISGNSQYAECSSSLPDLNSWSVGVWHYFDGTEIGGAPCIVTEIYPGTTGNINYSLGNNLGTFSAGFFNGGWEVSGGYTLTPNNWYYIVGTYDGSNINLYVNNTLISSVNYAGLAISSQGGIRLMMRWDLPDFWGGYLSKVDIYNGAIQPSVINNNWNASKDRFGFTGFTLNSSDFNNYGSGSGNYSNGNIGFSVNANSYIGPSQAFYSAYLGSTNGGSDTKLAEIYNYFINNGLSPNNTEYIFHVSWDGSGSAPTSYKVIIALDYNSPTQAYFRIGTVYTGDNNWQVSGANTYNGLGNGGAGAISLAPGTYNFPATFTLYKPIISFGANWC
jgi:hypothetical protein